MSDWKQVEELFHRALEIAPGDREMQLRVWCAGDAVLLAEILSLLRAEAEEAQITQIPADDPWIGRVLGQYRLDRLLGRGGMGAVYLANRTTGDFRHEVAIKIISTRLTSTWLRDRFLQERQILASLHHPNIARLLDGGITEMGDPFLVMEYIEGVRLDRYCQQTGANVHRVLELFLSLCDAVAYAHRNLIVHRDLKPNNVLVDANGLVKLLDFGTAKLSSPRSLNSGHTQMGLRAFTPDYASPEQMFGEPVTASSDVYSLGVILYRLLTGHLPFEVSGKAGADLGRTAYDTGPPTPSDAVTRVVAEAQQPASEATRLSERRRQIRGDLDAVVLKALRVAPKDRYASVEDIAADIRCYLENRPVKARAGSLQYRAGKFLRRHLTAVAAAVVLLLALGAGLVTTAMQARVAEQEERRAQAGFQSVRRLANLLLFDFYDQVKQLPGSTEVQRQLVTQALTYLDRLAIDSADDPDLRLDLIDAYTKMGNVQGNPYEQNLSDTEGSLASLKKGLALAEPLVATRGSDPRVLKRMAALTQSMGEVLFSQGKAAQAVQYTQRAAASFEQLASRPDAPLDALFAAASCLDSLGDQMGAPGLASLGNAPAALASYDKAASFQNRVLKQSPGHPRALRGIVISNMKTADLRRDADPSGAVQGYREALANFSRIPEENRRAVGMQRLEGMLLVKLGGVLTTVGLNEEAMERLASAERLYGSLIALDPRDTRLIYDMATVSYHRGRVLEDKNELVQARESYGQAVKHLDALLARSPDNAAYQGPRAESLYRMGVLSRSVGDTATGDSFVKRGFDLALELAARSDAVPNDWWRAANHLLTVEPAEWRDPKRALELASKAAKTGRTMNPEQLVTLAKAQRLNGLTSEARKTLSNAWSMLPSASAGSAIRRTIEEELSHLP